MLKDSVADTEAQDDMLFSMTFSIAQGNVVTFLSPVDS